MTKSRTKKKICECCNMRVVTNHGFTGYMSGCNCDLCRVAASVYHKRRRGQPVHPEDLALIEKSKDKLTLSLVDPAKDPRQVEMDLALPKGVSGV